MNGKKYWIWTWQTKDDTFVTVSRTRGYSAILDNFVKGFPNSTLVSDCWAAQLKTPSKYHQIYLAHLQRDLNYFKEQNKEKWSAKFSNLIKQALEIKSNMTKKSMKKFAVKVRSIIEQSEKLLAQKIIKGPEKLLTLQKRLIKRKDNLGVFLQDYDVPPDNNSSEWAIRNVKVKQKVSGQFKSMKGHKILS